jgi:hypothetical protein
MERSKNKSLWGVLGDRITCYNKIKTKNKTHYNQNMWMWWHHYWVWVTILSVKTIAARWNCGHL